MSQKAFPIRIFLFLSYLFGIEAISTFIHCRSSPENHTRFQTKMDKVYTRLQTGKAHTHTLWGGTYLYGLYKGVYPSPPRPRGLGSHFEVTENVANPSH